MIDPVALGQKIRESVRPLIIPYHGKRISYTSKDDARKSKKCDLDDIAEQCIIEIINKDFSDHEIVAEESGYRKTGSPYCWYVDGLDGTNEFIRGGRRFSSTIALTKHQEVLFSIIYRIYTDELYVASKEGGSILFSKEESFKLGSNISVRAVDDTENLRIIVPNKLKCSMLDRLKELHTCESIELTILGGSTSLHFAEIAEGVYDGMVSFRYFDKMQLFDLIPGGFLVQQAGLELCDAYHCFTTYLNNQTFEKKELSLTEPCAGFYCGNSRFISFFEKLYKDHIKIEREKDRLSLEPYRSELFTPPKNQS